MEMFDPSEVKKSARLNHQNTYMHGTQDPNINKKVQEKLNGLKDSANDLLNKLYEDISQEILYVDKFMIPVHGIPYPDYENPTNLFKRQLKIEELSFELAHQKY